MYVCILSFISHPSKHISSSEHNLSTPLSVSVDIQYMHTGSPLLVFLFFTFAHVHSWPHSCSSSLSLILPFISSLNTLALVCPLVFFHSRPHSLLSSTFPPHCLSTLSHVVSVNVIFFIKCISCGKLFLLVYYDTLKSLSSYEEEVASATFSSYVWQQASPAWV